MNQSKLQAHVIVLKNKHKENFHFFFHLCLIPHQDRRQEKKANKLVFSLETEKMKKETAALAKSVKSVKISWGVDCWQYWNKDEFTAAYRMIWQYQWGG